MLLVLFVVGHVVLECRVGVSVCDPANVGHMPELLFKYWSWLQKYIMHHRLSRWATTSYFVRFLDLDVK